MIGSMPGSLVGSVTQSGLGMVGSMPMMSSGKDAGGSSTQSSAKPKTQLHRELVSESNVFKVKGGAGGVCGGEGRGGVEWGGAGGGALQQQQLWTHCSRQARRGAERGHLLCTCMCVMACGCELGGACWERNDSMSGEGVGGEVGRATGHSWHECVE